MTSSIITLSITTLIIVSSFATLSICDTQNNYTHHSELICDTQHEMTLSITTLIIVSLFATLSINDTQHNGTQHNSVDR
jgi:hypothetical protein